VIRSKGRPDLRIYSDEIYEHILFDGEAHHSIASQPGMAKHTVIASGHSKGFAMTGWRLGFAVLPTVAEAEVFKQLNINTISCVPPFIQAAGCEAYGNPESSEATQRMVAEFQRRRDWIVPALNGIEGIRCQMPKGAFYVFPNVASICKRIGVLDSHRKLPDEVRARTTPSGMLQMFLLYVHGLATMDRNSFGSIGADGQHYLRLSIASSLEELQEGMSRLRRAAVDADGFASFVSEHYLS
jgi:aspartate/methionine/tyrosine aminotransferase